MTCRLAQLVSALVLCTATVLHAQAQPLACPAPAESRLPNLTTTAEGRALLSWVEADGDGHALRFATLGEAGWGQPRTAAKGERWFVNWADFPSLCAIDDDALAAHWLVRRGDGPVDYDVQVARSKDGGATWSAPLCPHDDGFAAEHGFVSLLRLDDGALGMCWLDGRATKQGGEDAHGHGHGPMGLRYAELRPDGTLAAEALLDARVCDCCQTSVARTDDGPLVVYRDRSDDEVRDIACVRRVDGRWTEPVRVFADDWKIAGCPVNGPSVAARGRHVAVAWFSAAQDRAIVRLSRSSDAGATWSEPVVVDDAAPTGRVTLAMGEDATAYVAWLGRDDGQGAVRLAEYPLEGEPEAQLTVGTSETGRRAGFPRLTLTKDEAVIAWTTDRVQTARLPLR